MAKCKDCIHYDACKDAYDGNWDDFDMYDLYCEYFKNKADFVEVKHGEWIAYDTEPYGDGIGEKETKWYKCSECETDALGRCYEDEYYSYPLRTDYCPYCGAKMDGKDINVPTK